MIATANELLAAFDALPPEEQRQVTIEIIRRSTGSDDLPEAAYDELAAELFRVYEAEEADHANP
jgi:hypothetical protein